MKTISRAILTLFVFGIATCLADEEYDCEGEEEETSISQIDPNECFGDLPTFFDAKTVKKCYEKLGMSVPKPISLSWIKNVEVAGCVITAEKLMDGSSLLSSKLFDFLNSKLEKDDFYLEGLRPAVDTCYGDLSSNRLRRLGSNHEDALKTKDGGASSSPVVSFILECIYAELMNFEVPKTKSNKPDYCPTLKDHVKKCGLW